MRTSLALCLAAEIVLGGCARTRDVLPRLDATAPPVEYTVRVPPGFDVVRTEFGASHTTATFADNVLAGANAQNAYVYVYATERSTGQSVVLVYGNLRERTTPVAILRLSQPDR